MLNGNLSEKAVVEQGLDVVGMQPHSRFLAGGERLHIRIDFVADDDDLSVQLQIIAVEIVNGMNHPVAGFAEGLAVSVRRNCLRAAQNSHCVGVGKVEEGRIRMKMHRQQLLN